MAHQTETKRCESCGQEHVVSERYVCDHCRGVMYEGLPKRIEWFETGISSNVKVLATPDGAPREVVTVIYEPIADRGKQIPLMFCCLTCALAFFRAKRPGQHEADDITISGSVRAFSQLPIGEAFRSD